MGWGIQNFKTPGSPWGGGFEIPWGIPNTNGFKRQKRWEHTLVRILRKGMVGLNNTSLSFNISTLWLWQK